MEKYALMIIGATGISIESLTIQYSEGARHEPSTKCLFHFFVI